MPTELMPARALSFDVDGTLYRVRRLRIAWYLRRQRRLLVAMLAAREKMRHEEPQNDLSAFLRREAELVAPSYGVTVAEMQKRLNTLREDMPSALTGGRAGPFKGVKRALTRAHEAGLKLAVLSDFEPKEKLKRLGLGSIPWAVTTASDAVGALKPHPHAFLRVAERLGVEPGEVVHVGDREDADVEGALAAGMRAWRFSRKGRVESRAEVVFSRWDEDLFQPLFPEHSPTSDR